MPAVMHFEANLVGKDYVVGDVHGQFSVLEKQLAYFFNPEVDRLFMCGDLVDRGPESHRVVEWLNKPWVHSVLGNHEAMLLDAAMGGVDDVGLYMLNGGGWFFSQSREGKDAIVAAVMDLPLAISVKRRDGTMSGIVHADIPYKSWKQSTEQITKHVRTYMLWSRDRMQGYVDFTIEDLHALYVGHTPSPTGTVLDGNIHYMDNGGWSRGGSFQIKEI